MKSTVGKPIRVVIVDDERLLAKALGAWLARDAGLKVVGYAESGNRGWELCQTTHPDLALVDVEMSDGDGLTLAKRLLDNLPGIRVIIMTGRVDPHTAWQAGQAGVHGLIDKTIEPEVLGQVIQLLVQGGRFLSPAFQKIREDWLTEPAAFPPLTWLTGQRTRTVLSLRPNLFIWEACAPPIAWKANSTAAAAAVLDIVT